jgi:hypothetical protein
MLLTRVLVSWALTALSLLCFIAPDFLITVLLTSILSPTANTPLYSPPHACATLAPLPPRTPAGGPAR